MILAFLSQHYSVPIYVDARDANRGRMARMALPALTVLSALTVTDPRFRGPDGCHGTLVWAVRPEDADEDVRGRPGGNDAGH